MSSKRINKQILWKLLVIGCFLTSNLFAANWEKEQFMQVMKSKKTLSFFQEDLNQLLDLIDRYTTEIKEHYSQYTRNHSLEALEKEGYTKYVNHFDKMTKSLDKQFIVQAIPFVFFGYYQHSSELQEGDSNKLRQVADEILKSRWKEYQSHLRHTKREDNKPEFQIVDESIESVKILSQELSGKYDFFQKLFSALKKCNSCSEFFFQLLGNLEFLQEIKYKPEQEEGQLKELYEWSRDLYWINDSYHHRFQDLAQSSHLALILFFVNPCKP